MLKNFKCSISLKMILGSVWFNRKYEGLVRFRKKNNLKFGLSSVSFKKSEFESSQV